MAEIVIPTPTAPKEGEIVVAPITGGEAALPSRMVARTLMFPTPEEFKMLETFAKIAYGAKVFGYETYEKALLVAMKSWYLGIDAFEGFQQIVFIQGKMTIQVQLMIGLANRSNKLSVFSIPNPDDCVKTGSATVTCVRVDRPGEKYVGTFTRADADKAKLLERPIWKAYEGQMLVNRAVSLTLRRAIPEVLGGFYLSEELEEDERPREPVAKPAAQKAQPPTITATAPLQPSETAASLTSSVVEEQPPWWTNSKDILRLVDRSIEVGYLAKGQTAADLLKLIDRENWKGFDSFNDAGLFIKTVGERLKAEAAAAKAPTEPPPAAAPATAPEDDTVYEVEITQASYDGKTIVFKTLQHGPVEIWSRKDLAEMVGETWAAKYNLLEWQGSKEKPTLYTFTADLLTIGYKIVKGKPKLVKAVPEIPF